MIQLILKDILLQKKRLLYFPLLYNIFSIVILQDFFLPYLVGGIVVPYLMLLTAIVYEDINKSEIVINSLPIKKEKIIMSRYLSTFVYLVISILSYLLILFLVDIFNLPFAVDLITIPGIVDILIGLGIIVSIYLPIFYKYGYVKGRLLHTLFTVAALLLPTTIVKIIKENPELVFFKSFITFIQGLSVGKLSFIILIFTLLIMTISFYISLSFYKRREF